MGPKMILLLGFVDLDDRIASSNWIQPRHSEYNPWHSWSQVNLLAEIVLSFHTYRFLNASCRLCVAENDCMWPCLVKMHAFLFSELQIAPIYLVLQTFPSFLVWSSFWFCQIAWKFPHPPDQFHAPLDSLWWRTRVQFTRVPDVEDVLGKSFRYYFIVLQRGINSFFSWMSFNCSKVQDLIGEFGLMQYVILFLAPPPFARVDVHSSSDHGEAPSNFFLHSSMTSLYWIAPSISRWTVWSCRSNRVLAFDTSKHFDRLIFVFQCLSIYFHKQK